MARQRQRPNFDFLRGLIERSLAGCPEFDGRVEVDGEIAPVQEGLWHDNYRFRIRGRGLSPKRLKSAYILRLLERRYDWQQGPKPRRRLVREAKTLQVLQEIGFGHPTPEFLCFVKDEEAQPIGMIETALIGSSLDNRRERTTLQLIGRVAATIHEMTTDLFPHLTASADRTQYVQSKLKKLDPRLLDEFPVTSEVRDWIQAHTPSGDYNCVLHGDLLPQNLIQDSTGSDHNEAIVGIIDWEMAHIGDPAYDLSVVCRGNRRVLGVNSGAKFLVKAYLACGGKPISLIDVRVHEMLLILHWLEESCRNSQIPPASGHGPEFYEKHLRSLLRRVVK